MSGIREMPACPPSIRAFNICKVVFLLVLNRTEPACERRIHERAAAEQGLPGGQGVGSGTPSPDSNPSLWGAQLQNKGYLEDRRPAANVDPYIVARLLLKTTFS